MSLTDYTGCGVQKPVGGIFADVDGIARLKDVKFFDHFEQEIRNLADTITAIRQNAPDVDVGKIV